MRSYANLTKLAQVLQENENKPKSVTKPLATMAVPAAVAYGAHRYLKSDLSKVTSKKGKKYQDAAQSVLDTMHNMSPYLRKGKDKARNLRIAERGGLLVSGVGLGLGTKGLYDAYQSRKKRKQER